MMKLIIEQVVGEPAYPDEKLYFVPGGSDRLRPLDALPSEDDRVIPRRHGV